MTRHNTLDRLRHMRDHTREAIELSAGRTRTDLENQREFNLAIVRLLEIVGEAAARGPEIERANWPEIAWADIVGLRNRIVHGYDDVNLDIVWGIVTRNLPPLVRELERILGD